MPLKKRTRMFLMAVPSSTLLLCSPRAAFECCCRSSPAGWSHFSLCSCLFKLTTFSHKVNRDNLVKKKKQDCLKALVALLFSESLNLTKRVLGLSSCHSGIQGCRHCPFNLARLPAVFLLQLSPAVKMIPDGFRLHAEHHVHLNKCHLGHF